MNNKVYLQKLLENSFFNHSSTSITSIYHDFCGQLKQKIL